MKLSIGAARWRVALACAIGLVAAAASAPALVNNVAPRVSNHAASPRANVPPTLTHQIRQTRAAAHPLQTPAMRGFPYDWSHRHLVFSRPSSPAIAQRLERDPRYRIQQAWRARQARSGSVDEYMQALDTLATQLAAGDATRKVLVPSWGKPLPHHRLRGDWSVNLGSGAKVGAGRYPAKFSFDPIGAPNCTSDFVVFNTGLNGTSGVSGKASIIAYNNLYATTCATPVPKTYWAYNTGGPITNSIVLSSDGAQVAFVHGGSPASLVILRPIAGQGSATAVTSAPSPDVLCTSSGCTGSFASYASCKINPAKSCQLTLPFSSSTLSNDSNSAPFYDFTNDIIYVGDDGGFLHKFTGVFDGSPAEVTASPWPATMHANAVLTSPVPDSGVTPSVVYVAVATGGSSSGLLDYASTATPGLRTESAALGFNPIDIADAPIVDPSAGKIYVAVGNDGTTRGLNSGVFVFGRGFSSIGTGLTSSSGIEAKVGTASNLTPIALYNGDFDNAYYNSSSGIGNLYVCGNTGGDPTIYQVPITINNIGSVRAGPNLTSASTTCSPVTEIYNTSASSGPFDWIFLSVQGSGSLSNCGSTGCLMNFIVTAWQASNPYSLNQEILDTNLNLQKVTTAGTSGTTHPTWNTTGTTADNSVVWTSQGSMSANAASRAETGGTSGIVIDNTSSTTGASQVYFSTLTNGTCATSGTSGGCAVQASQSGLSQ